MLAGCGSDNSAANDNKNNTSAEAEKTASKDGDFNLTVNFASEPMTMDPALNSSVDGSVMANHLFEGLMNGRAQVRKLKVLTEHAMVQNLLTVRLRAMTKQQMMMEL